MNAIAIDTSTASQSRQARQAWRQHARARSATAAQHAVMGLLAGKDIDTMFTPISNATKLANGARAHAGRDLALDQACSGDMHAWQPWAGLLESATVQEKWGRRRYDMASHPLLARALAAAPR